MIGKMVLFMTVAGTLVVGMSAEASRTISPGSIVKAFPSTHDLLRSEDGVVPPKDIVEEWLFMRRSGFPSGASVILYTDSTRARQAAVIDRSGKVVHGVVCPYCKTYRVSNALLVVDFEVSNAERRVLSADLEKLGKPVSP